MAIIDCEFSDFLELETAPGQLSQVLGIQQALSETSPDSFADVLSFTDTFAIAGIFSDALSFVETFASSTDEGLSNNLSLSDTFDTDGDLSVTLSDIIDFNDAFADADDVDTCRLRNYTPSVGGSSSDKFTPPSSTPPTLGQATVTLTYPFISPTETLVLRNPVFGDRDRLQFSRINRESRGGDAIIFADPQWPKNQVLVVQIDSLSELKASDLIDFLEMSIGQEIGLLDWFNQQWRGVIITPDVAITHVRRNDRSVSFDFQGQLA